MLWPADVAITEFSWITKINICISNFVSWSALYSADMLTAFVIDNVNDSIHLHWMLLLMLAVGRAQSDRFLDHHELSLQVGPVLNP